MLINFPVPLFAQTMEYPLPANHAEHPLYLFQEQPPQLPHGGVPQHMYQPHHYYHHHQQQQQHIMQPQPYWQPPPQPFGEAHNQGPPSHYLSHPQVQVCPAASCLGADQLDIVRE